MNKFNIKVIKNSNLNNYFGHCIEHYTPIFYNANIYIRVIDYKEYGIRILKENR
jgi:hypothetical protein